MSTCALGLNDRSDVPVTVGVHADNVARVADWVDVLSFQTSHRLQQPEPPTPHVRRSLEPRCVASARGCSAVHLETLCASSEIAACRARGCTAYAHGIWGHPRTADSHREALGSDGPTKRQLGIWQRAR